MVFISDIVVPVRPMPAEQCTMDFSLSADFKFHSTKWFSITSKSLMAGPSGTPWSGHPMKCIYVIFCILPSGFVAYNSRFKTNLFEVSSFWSTNFTKVVIGCVSDYVILNSICLSLDSGQNWLHFYLPYSLVLQVLTIIVTFYSMIIYQKCSVVAGSGPWLAIIFLLPYF